LSYCFLRSLPVLYLKLATVPEDHKNVFLSSAPTFHSLTKKVLFSSSSSSSSALNVRQRVILLPQPSIFFPLLHPYPPSQQRIYAVGFHALIFPLFHPNKKQPLNAGQEGRTRRNLFFPRKLSFFHPRPFSSTES
jgi:hypothetical protein